VWFRVVKYILLGSALYFFWGNSLLWIILLIFFVFALLLHFGTGTKRKAGQKVMACGNMTKRILSKKTADF
jgi:asparagine N-glycosylation enzyme membrane subunit Stt3